MECGNCKRKVELDNRYINFVACQADDHIDMIRRDNSGKPLYCPHKDESNDNNR